MKKIQELSEVEKKYLRNNMESLLKTYLQREIKGEIAQYKPPERDIPVSIRIVDNHLALQDELLPLNSFDLLQLQKTLVRRYGVKKRGVFNMMKYFNVHRDKAIAFALRTESNGILARVFYVNGIYKFSIWDREIEPVYCTYTQNEIPAIMLISPLVSYALSLGINKNLSSKIIMVALRS